MTETTGAPRLFGRLGRRLTLVVVAFSLLIAVLASAVQLYQVYEQDMAEIEEDLDFIATVFLRSLADSVWTANSDQVTLALEGLVALPTVDRVRVVAPHQTWSAGTLAAAYSDLRRFPLVHAYRGSEQEIGTLEVVFNLDFIRDDLIDQALTLLAINAARALLIAGFLILVVHAWVTRHIVRIADYSAAIDLDAPFAPLVLDKRRRARPDEIDTLVDGLNARTRELKRAHDDTEELVAERTRVLADTVRSLRAEIAARQEAEAALSLAQKALDLTNDGVMWVRPDGGLRYANGAVARLAGRADAGRNRISDLVRNCDEAGWRALWADLATRRQVTRELRLARPDRDDSPVEASFNLIDGSGEPFAFVSIRDISERLAGERVQRLSQRVIATASDGIAVIEPDGTCRLVNGAFADLFATTPETLTGRPLTEKEGDIGAVIADTLDQCLAGAEIDREDWFPDPDGRQRYLVMHQGPLAAPEAGAEGVLVVIRDLTELKRNEERLTRALADADRSNQELEQFAYVASHDLRAPLRGIRNLAGWIRDDLGPDTDPDILENIDLLHGRVDRLETLLEGLLEYSRVGRVEEAATEVDVRVLIDEVVDYMALPPGMTVEVATPMPVIHTSRAGLELVFRNLIGNAVKHHDRDSGRIQVAAEAAGAGCWQFSVTDDGPGIPVDMRERVFGMFQTLRPRDEVEGSGMGLSVVKKAIECHGGHVALLDPPGGGRGIMIRFEWCASAADGNGKE